jgi:glycosyltransferase involved in cell wall biosynthesis
MERFAQMLQTGFAAEGIQAEIWRPVSLLGTYSKSTTVGLGKWLGYIDKWILFPIIIRWRSLFLKGKKEDLRFHVCDHSNAPYLSHLPLKRTVVTCHDVLAIRGALGYKDAYCPASGMGKLLQQWILSNLVKAENIAAVSQLTLDQLKELAKDKVNIAGKDWRVIHNAFNADFRIMEKAELAGLPDQTGVDTTTPFLLHVGSKLARKNRKLLLDMVAEAGDNWKGNICFAGQELDPALIAHAKALGIWERVVSVVKPKHEVLVALYNTCFAFIFPSFSEGFGWPVIEAQACGAVVIASNVAPMPEISGGAALHADPHDKKAFAEALLLLQDPALKKQLVSGGLKNIARFEFRKIMAAYMSLHNLKQLNKI